MSDSYNDLMPGRFLNAEALAAGPKTLTVKTIGRENVAPKDKEPELKAVVRFEEIEQGIVLNQERKNVLVELFGSAPSDAEGKKVEVFQGKTRFGGKLINCVAFRAVTATRSPAKQAAAKAAATVTADAEPAEKDIPY